MVDTHAVQVALLLAVVVKVILDYVAKPVRSKFPDLDLWWFDYVALALGAVVTWFAALNLFTPTLTNQLIGRILTALLVGGGAKLINDIYVVAQGGGSLAEPPANRSLTPDEATIPSQAERKIGW